MMNIVIPSPFFEYFQRKSLSIFLCMLGFVLSDCRQCASPSIIAHFPIRRFVDDLCIVHIH